MADALVKKIAKDHIREQAIKKSGYVFNAPEKNERGKKLSKSEKARWEFAQYSDPRWAIPEHDLKILMACKKRAKTLDAGHRIGPIKFGQSAILGVIPGIGDFADVILAFLRVYCHARKISPGEDLFALKSKMKANIVLLGAIGCIPILGDLADTILMFNTRNAAMLEKLLLKRSGYFEVMAKEKLAKKSRGRRQQSAAHSEVSLPPPRYESPHSVVAAPSAHHRSDRSRSASAHRARNILALTNQSNHSDHAFAPPKPTRPEVVQTNGHGRTRRFF